jgi:hypothetical protein
LARLPFRVGDAGSEHEKTKPDNRNQKPEAPVSNFIAIDLDSQGLYAVVGSSRGGARVTHALSWTNEDDEAPPALTAETAKAFGEKLRDKLRAAGVPQAPVIVAVGRDRIILKELKYPQVPPAEEPALVRFQAMKEMSESPDEVVLDYAPLGEAGGERRSMAVVVRKDLFGAIQAMCLAAGLKLAGVTPRPYASAAGLMRAFAGDIAPPPADKADAVAALALSPAGGEFTVVRRGEVMFTLAIPAPVVANETMLVAQIRRNLTVYAGQHPGHPIQGVYVAEVDGPWAPRLQAALSVPVHAFDPLAGAVPDVPEALRGRFAGAVGLLAGRAANALPINFVTPRQPQVEKDPAKRRLAFVAIGAIALVLLVTGGGLWFVGANDDRINELRIQRDNLKDDVAKGAPNEVRAKGIDGWSKREVVWLDELYELASRMPDNDSVRVSSLTAVPIQPDKNGKSDGNARIELKLAAANAAGVDALESAIVRDNTSPNRYYLGTIHSGGTPLPTKDAGKHNVGFTLVTRVNHRDPGEYTKATPFVPLKKSSGGAGGGTAMAPHPSEAP